MINFGSSFSLRNSLRKGSFSIKIIYTLFIFCSGVAMASNGRLVAHHRANECLFRIVRTISCWIEYSCIHSAPTSKGKSTECSLVQARPRIWSLASKRRKDKFYWESNSIAAPVQDEPQPTTTAWLNTDMRNYSYDRRDYNSGLSDWHF